MNKTYGVSGSSSLKSVPQDTSEKAIRYQVFTILAQTLKPGDRIITGTGLVPDLVHEYAERYGYRHITLVPQVYAEYANNPYLHSTLKIEGVNPEEEVPYYLTNIDTLLVFGGGQQTQNEIKLAPQYNVNVIQYPISQSYAA